MGICHSSHRWLTVCRAYVTVTLHQSEWGQAGVRTACQQGPRLLFRCIRRGRLEKVCVHGPAQRSRETAFSEGFSVASGPRKSLWVILTPPNGSVHINTFLYIYIFFFVDYMNLIQDNIWNITFSQKQKSCNFICTKTWNTIGNDNSSSAVFVTWSIRESISWHPPAADPSHLSLLTLTTVLP